MKKWEPYKNSPFFIFYHKIEMIVHSHKNVIMEQSLNIDLQ